MIKQKGFTIWLTGLPKTGKSELASIIEEDLLERGLNVEVIDENIFQEINIEKFDYSHEYNNKISKTTIFICNLLNRNNVISIVAQVTPYNINRNLARKELGDFIEVYIDSSEEEIKYEKPQKPEVIINTKSETIEMAAKKVLKTIEILNWVPKVFSDDYSDEEEKKIQERLESLGYL